MFAGTAVGGAAGAPAAFLDIDYGWRVERGRGDWRGRVGASRGQGGFGRRAACHHRRLCHHRSRCLCDTCRLPSGRSLQSSMPRVLGCGRSPGTWGGRDRRSRESCAAMPPRVVASWIIGPRRRSGMLNGLLDGQSLQSWYLTRRCEPMCRIGCWHGRGCKRCCGSWTDYALERSPTWTTQGSALGVILES